MLTVKKMRGLRAAAMAPIFFLLIAARTSVAPMPETMVGVDTDIERGVTVNVKEGDVILRAKVFATEIATLKEPVSVAIAKFSQDIAADTPLDPVVVSRKTESLTGTSGFIYCGENQRTRSKFAEAMIGDFLSKYETIVRFCFVDTDNDAKLDRVFLAGAKDKADQQAVEIEPVAFERRKFTMDDDARTLEIRVNRLIKKRGRADKIEFKIHLFDDETDYGFSYIASTNGGPIEENYPLIKTNPRKVPYPSEFPNIMGAGITILDVDAEKGEAQIRVKRNFTTRFIKPVTIQYNYVYIYY